MKKFLIYFLVLVLSLSLVACAKEEKKTEGEDKQVTIRLLTRWGEGASPTTLDSKYYEAVKQFQIDNPQIKIEDESIAGSDDTVFFQKVKASMATGDAPDIIYNYGGGVNKEYIKNDKFLDLTPYFEADPEWYESIKSYLDLWQFDDIKGTYGVPLKVFYITLFYNKDLFKEHNLEVPKTIEEFEAVAEKFLKLGISPMTVGAKESWRTAHLATTLTMVMEGPEIIGKLGTRKAKHTDPEMVAVYSKIDEWREKGYFGENPISLDFEMEKNSFMTGKSAMNFNGTWFLGSLGDSDAAKTTNFGVTYFPYLASKPQFKHHTMGSSNGGLSIYKSGDKAKEDAAVLFLKYLHNFDNVKKFFADGALEYGPVRKEGLLPNFPDQDLYKEYAAIVSDPTVVVRQEVDVYDPLPQMVDTYRDAIQGMFAGNTPQQCAEQIQAEIDANQ